MNLNRKWTGNDEQQTAYAAALSFSLTERLGAFVEVCGCLSEDVTAQYEGDFRTSCTTTWRWTFPPAGGGTPGRMTTFWTSTFPSDLMDGGR